MGAMRKEARSRLSERNVFDQLGAGRSREFRDRLTHCDRGGQPRRGRAMPQPRLAPKPAARLQSPGPPQTCSTYGKPQNRRATTSATASRQHHQSAANTTNGSPALTVIPDAHTTRSTRPAEGAVTCTSIFMASTISSVSPSATRCPATT